MFVSKKTAIKTLITIPSILVLAACGGGGGGGGAGPGAINTAPVFTSDMPTASIAQDVSYNFDVNATDADGDTLVYSFTGNPSWLSIDSATGVMSGTPLNVDVGTTSGIVVGVTDNNSALVSQAAFSITVTNVNDAPVFTSGTPIASVAQDVSYNFDVNATDTDGDTLVYSFTGNPTWLSIDSATGVMSGTPLNVDVGTTSGIVVGVTDNNSALVSQAAFSITVTNVNDAPVFTSGTPIASVAQDASYNFDVNATDTDGDTLVYSVTGNPTWLSIDSETGVMSGTPLNVDVGTTSGIVVSVTDNNSAPVSQAVFNITVTDVNDAPIISGTPQTVTIAGGMYDFTPTASDVDVGDILMYSISGNDPWLSIDANTGQLTGLPMPSDIGTTTVTVAVTDSNAASDALTFDIVVANSFNEALYSQLIPSPTTSLVAMNEVADGIATNGWTATDATPFMEFALDTTTELHRIDLRDLPAIDDQVTAATITFMSNNNPVGSPISTGTLTNDGSIVSFAISPPVRADNVRITLNTTTGAKGLAEVEIYSALAPGQSEIIAGRDLFNTDSTSTFIEEEECEFVTSLSDTATWTHLNSANSAGISNALVQTGRCRGISVNESAVTGTFFVKNVFPGALGEFDLRLRVRSEAGDVSSPDAGGDSTGIGTDPFLRGMIGIMFNYSDANNYYRYQISQRDGHRKIMKKSNGVFAQLAQSTQSFTLNEWVNIRIVRQNGVIIVFQDGEQVLAAVDAELNGTQLALFCAKNRSCFYDNLIVLDAPSTPIIALSSPAASFVGNSGTLAVSAVTNESMVIDGVEFVLNDGVDSFISPAPGPFFGSFELGSVADNYVVKAYALDSDGSRLTNTSAVDESAQIGINGITILTVGDSITEGLRDDHLNDDVSSIGINAGRITSGGYQPLLVDLMTASNTSLPISMLTEANGNESAELGSQRIASLLARYPEAEAVLVKYGSNDHDRVASGLGTIANVDEPDTFKDFMQIIINQINAVGVKAILAIPLQVVNSAAINNNFSTGREYRDVIFELISDNNLLETPDSLAIGGGVLNPPIAGPDFFQFFTLDNTDKLDDDQIHPNNEGYISMSNAWCGVLNGQLVGDVTIVCSP